MMIKCGSCEGPLEKQAANKVATGKRIVANIYIYTCRSCAADSDVKMGLGWRCSNQPTVALATCGVLNACVFSCIYVLLMLA